MAKKSSAVKRREQTILMHKTVRWGIQAIFFIFAPAVFSGAFNGIKYLFTQLGLVEPIEATSFLVVLISLLVFTVVFGRFFCGYACAFGTLGDVLYAIPEFIRVKAGLPRPKLPNAVIRALSLLKYVVLAAICWMCFVGIWGAFSGDSPWVGFAAILSGSVEGVSQTAFVLLAVIAVGMMLHERFFCQFLCPLGAIFSLMPVLGFSEFTRKRAHCAHSCGKCKETCPVDIWPDGDTITHGECISCGRCADVCPMSNVNLVALEKAASKSKRAAAQPEESSDASRRNELKPVKKSRQNWYIWRGTGIAYTLAKAVLLFAVCWIVGTTRYVVPFSEIVGLLPPLF